MNEAFVDLARYLKIEQAQARRDLVDSLSPFELAQLKALERIAAEIAETRRVLLSEIKALRRT